MRQVLHTEKMIDSFTTNELKDWVSKVTKFVNKTTRMIDSSLITINEIPYELAGFLWNYKDSVSINRNIGPNKIP